MKSQYSREVISHLKGHARDWRVPRVYGYLPNLPQADFSPTHLHWPSLKSRLLESDIAGFREGEERCRKPAAHAHPPALGADAAGPACDDTVHMRVVSVVPSTVFGADLGEKEKQMGRGHFPHTPNSWPIGDQHRSKTRIETSR